MNVLDELERDIARLVRAPESAPPSDQARARYDRRPALARAIDDAFLTAVFLRRAAKARWGLVLDAETAAFMVTLPESATGVYVVAAAEGKARGIERGRDAAADLIARAHLLAELSTRGLFEE